MTETTLDPEAIEPEAERDFVRSALPLLGVAVAYYVAAELSLNLSLIGESVTPLWPPTGIALAAFVVFGLRVWPAVAVAAFLVNLPISPSAGAAAGIAAGNTAAPAVAWALLRLAKFRPELDRTRDALALVVLGALVGMTVSATGGTLSLIRSEAVAGNGFWPTWAVWWAGDAMGILAVTPFLLELRSLRVTRPIAWERIAEAVLLLGALCAVAALLHVTARPYWVGVFPVLVLIAWRFQQRGASVASLLAIIAASSAAARDAGPFAGAQLLPTMVELQVFNAAVALTSFFFAAVVAERIEAASALERSSRELYLREHRIAETLQRSLLPTVLPTPPDVEVAARYIPASGDIDVGGDWYDIIPVPDGRIGLVIGDVAGNGVAAAAAMGQIRMALRAYGLEGMSPATALGRLNTLVDELQPGVMATLAYAHLDPETGTVVLAKAGHPPPLIVTAGGDASFVADGLAPPVGVSPLVTYEETTVHLAAGSTMLLYTDGLVERRGETLDDGLARLSRAAMEAPGDLEAASDHIVASLMRDGSSDDAAILSVRRVEMAGMPLSLEFRADTARLSDVRRAVARWLSRNGAAEAESTDILVACTEACANASQHAYGSSDGSVRLEATADDGVVAVTVRDFGHWRDASPAEDGDRGRGLQIMRGLMETMELTTSDHGTVVKMSRRLGATHDG